MLRSSQGQMASSTGRISSQNNEKVKTFSRKLARLVSGGGGSSNSRTPNSKKKYSKQAQASSGTNVLSNVLNNPVSTHLKLRSGANTSRSTGMGS
jgi:hypothetical protein